MTKIPDTTWDWWRKAKADPSRIGSTDLPIHADGYQCGYYRTRSREDGSWADPVGIYPVQGVVCGFRNGKPVDDLVDLFLWCCRYPVSFDAYKAALAGGGWADEPPRSSNAPDDADEDDFARLQREYLAEKELIDAFLKKPIASQDDADKVAIWKKRITTIRSKAELFHKTEKQPHLDAGRAVDDKWRPLKEEPNDYAKALGDHLLPWLRRQKAEEEERQRKAAAAAARIQREADEAAAAAQAEQDKADEEAARGNIDPDADKKREAAEEAAREAQRKADEAAREAEAKKVTAGRTGARSGLVKIKVGKVNDYEKAALALVKIRHKDMIELIDTLANRAAKAGMPFDGMTIEDEDTVR